MSDLPSADEWQGVWRAEEWREERERREGGREGGKTEKRQERKKERRGGNRITGSDDIWNVFRRVRD